MTGALLLDISGVPPCHCDHALDGLYKALAEDPKGTARHSIWAPHENPYLTGLIEDWTGRVQVILAQMQDALTRVLAGEPMGTLTKAETPWLRWDQDQFDQVRRHLAAKPRSTWTLDDWLLVVDWLIQRYLPDRIIGTLAQYLTVRSALAGKIQANMTVLPPEERPAPEALMAALEPTTIAAVPPQVLTPTETAMVKFAQARAAENIGSVVGETRHKLKAMVITHVEAQALGAKDGTVGVLSQKMFDAFGDLNRDFRRIAITEAGDACNQGVVAGQKPGARLQRVEVYQGACRFCQSINGKIVTVVDPSKPDKDGETEVWVGKTNIGRSASPRKRVGDDLVQRGADERWWIAAGVQHPHCRGSWLPLAEAKPEYQEFDAWLAKLAAESKARVYAAAKEERERRFGPDPE